MRTLYQTREPDFKGNFKPGFYPVINDASHIDKVGQVNRLDRKNYVKSRLQSFNSMYYV